MARSNPKKRKPREAKKTALIVCEGKTEYAFMRYLKMCYCGRGCGIQIKIEVRAEGSPQAIIKAAKKLLVGRAYNICLISMDTDIKWPSDRPKSSHRTKILYFGSSPCFEGFLLELISPRKFTTWTSDRCKKHFHRHYLFEDEKYVPDNYSRILPKKLLDKKRSGDQRLDNLIELFEGKI